MPIRPEDFDASPRRVAVLKDKAAAERSSGPSREQTAKPPEEGWVKRHLVLVLGGTAAFLVLVAILTVSYLTSTTKTAVVVDTPAFEENPNSLDKICIVAMLAGTESSPYLARLVRQKGIDFEPDQSFLDELRQLTAEAVLIDELRRAKRFKPKTVDSPATSEAVLTRLLSGAKSEIGENYSVAEQDFRVAVDLEPTNMAVYLPLGRSLLDQRHPEEAEAVFRKAVELEPISAVAHSDLGNALEAKGSLDAAIAEQRVAISLSPDYADAHGNLAHELMAKNDREGALAEYREAIRVQPDLLSWRMNLANDLRDKRHLAEAIAEYQEVIRLKPDYAAAHTLLGMAYRDNKNWNGDVREQTLAVQLQPKSAPPHNELGVALTWTGDWDRADSEFREAIRLAPGWAIAHRNLGSVLEHKQDFAGALEEYKKAYSIDPRDAMALSDYKRMQRMVQTYR
jgi:superkiller protein 3